MAILNTVRVVSHNIEGAVHDGALKSKKMYGLVHLFYNFDLRRFAVFNPFVCFWSTTSTDRKDLK